MVTCFIDSSLYISVTIVPPSHLNLFGTCVTETALIRLFDSFLGENNAQKDNDVAFLSKSSGVVDELWQQLGSLHSR